MVVIFFPWEDYLASRIAYRIMYNLGEDKVIPVVEPPRNDLLIKDAVKNAKLIIVLVVHPEAKFSAKQIKDMDLITESNAPVYALIPKDYVLPPILQKNRPFIITHNLHLYTPSAIPQKEVDNFMKSVREAIGKLQGSPDVEWLLTSILLVLFGAYIFSHLSQKEFYGSSHP